MAQADEDVDKGDDGSDEGDDTDEEGERGGGLLAVSPTPPREEEAAGLLLKPGAGDKSMGQESRWSWSQAVKPGGCGPQGKRGSSNKPSGKKRAINLWSNKFILTTAQVQFLILEMAK